MNHSIHSYNTTSNVNITIDENFAIRSINKSNILHTKCSKLVNYGGKMIQAAGPLLWNSLPELIRNCKSNNIFKFKLKLHLLNQYSTPTIPVTNHYYVSKLSLCSLKLTLTKMKSFFVPVYIPGRSIQTRFVSKIFVSENKYI